MESILGRIHRKIYENKLSRRIHGAFRRSIDGRFDRQYGVDTAGRIPVKYLRSRDTLPESSWGYMATPPGEFDRLIHALPIRTRDYHFIDIGSGKARTTFMAAMCDFRSVTGIEVSRALYDVSLRNAIIMREHGVMKCEPELLNMDALEYDLPKGPLLLYAYNPFKRKAMERFAGQVAEAYATSPRHIVLACRIPDRYAVGVRVLEDHPMFKEIVLNASLPKYIRVFEIAETPSRHDA